MPSSSYASSRLRHILLSTNGRRWSVLGLMALIAAIDVLTDYVNLPILYTIPAMLHLRSGTARHRWRLAGAVCVLAPLGLFFTLTGTEGYRPHTIEGYRIFNRVMAILLVCAIAAAGGFLQTMRVRVQGRVDDPSDPDQAVYYQMLLGLEKFVVIAVSAACALVIFALDLITPTAFNASILYGLPLLLFMAAHSFRVLWSALFVLVVLAWLGFVLGPQEGPDWLLTKLFLNRVLVTVALLFIAFIGHMWGRFMQKKDGI